MNIGLNLIQNPFFVLAFAALLLFLGFFVKTVLRKKPKIQNAETKENTGQSAPSQVAPEYKSIMHTAHKEARNMLYDTTIAAHEILKGTKKTNEHLEAQLDKVLQNIAAQDIHTLKETTKSFDVDYQENLQKLQTEMQKASEEMLEDIKKQYNEKLDSFLQELLKNGSSTQSVVDGKTAELLSKAEAEIAEYKKNKLAGVDEEVGRLVQTVYSDVLRISIPENVHQELIVKSLEEAKKDGMFKL